MLNSWISETCDVFGSLSSPVRMQVLLLLNEREEEAGNGGLRGSVEPPQSEQAMAKHLARLTADGFVRSRREGGSVLYRLTDRGSRLAGLARIVIDECRCHPNDNPCVTPARNGNGQHA